MEASTRYLVERRVRVPLLMSRFRELEGEPTRDVIESGRLHVQPADAEVPLPVLKAADLREAVFFTEGGEPPDPLAGELARLASQGWSFHGVIGGALAQVGLYGAYNALTDPEVGVSELQARRGSTSLPLQDAPEAAAVLAFYAEPNAAARLEAEGFAFFDSEDRRSTAFTQRHAATLQVGRGDERWFETTPERVEAEARDFQVLREAAGELGTARHAWEAFTGARPIDWEAASTLAHHPRYEFVLKWAVELAERLDQDVSRRCLLEAVLPRADSQEPSELRAIAHAAVGALASRSHSPRARDVAELAAHPRALAFLEQVELSDWSRLNLLQELRSDPDVTRPERHARMAALVVERLSLEAGLDYARRQIGELKQHEPFAKGLEEGLALAGAVSDKQIQREVLRQALRQPGQSLGERVDKLDETIGRWGKSEHYRDRCALQEMALAAHPRALAFLEQVELSDWSRLSLLQELRSDPDVTRPERHARMAALVVERLSLADGLDYARGQIGELKHHEPFAKGLEEGLALAGAVSDKQIQREVLRQALRKPSQSLGERVDELDETIARWGKSEHYRERCALQEIGLAAHPEALALVDGVDLSDWSRLGALKELRADPDVSRPDRLAKVSAQIARSLAPGPAVTFATDIIARLKQHQPFQVPLEGSLGLAEELPGLAHLVLRQALIDPGGGVEAVALKTENLLKESSDKNAILQGALERQRHNPERADLSRLADAVRPALGSEWRQLIVARELLGASPPKSLEERTRLAADVLDRLGDNGAQALPGVLDWLTKGSDLAAYGQLLEALKTGAGSSGLRQALEDAAELARMATTSSGDPGRLEVHEDHVIVGDVNLPVESAS